MRSNVLALKEEDRSVSESEEVKICESSGPTLVEGQTEEWTR